MLERERERGRGEREVRSKQGIFFLQRGMKRDMGEVGLGYIWFSYVFIKLKIPSNAGHNS